MNKLSLTILRWGPRVLSIIFILFVSMFSLDVFSQGYGILETLVALFIQLIPSFFLLIFLLIAWRSDWAGILFMVMSPFFLWLTWDQEILSQLIFTSSPVLIGFFFLAGWWLRIKPRSGC